MSGPKTLCAIGIFVLGFAALGAKPPKTEPSRIDLTISGAVSAHFEGPAPYASARRERTVGAKGRESLRIRLKGKPGPKDDVEITVEADVTSKPAFAEAGRYSLKPSLDAGTGSCTGHVVVGGARQGWVACKSGELVVEASDEKRVRGHVDAAGPCGPKERAGECTFRARFDVRREPSGR